MDRLTKILSASTLALQLYHPYRTALGAILGIALSMIGQPIIKVYQISIDTSSNVYYLGCISIGILILHLPNLIRLLFKPEEAVFDENFQKAIAIISTARKHGLSERAEKDLYLELCEGYLKNTIRAHEKQEKQRIQAD